MTTTRFGRRSISGWLALTAVSGVLPWIPPVLGEPGGPAGREPEGREADDLSRAAPVFRANSPAEAPSGANHGATDSAPASKGGVSSADAVSDWLDQTVKSPAAGGTALVRRHQADSAAGAESTEAESNSILPVSKPSSGWLNVLWPLLFVLALITGAAVAFRRWLWRVNRFGAGGALDVLARHSLSPKQSLCLLRLGRRVLLVGVTPERITPVADIMDPDEVAAIVAAVERGKPKSFTTMFTRLAEREWGKEDAPVAETDMPVAPGQLTAAGANVRDLLSRVRGLAAAAKPSAEPTR